ncbi:MAG: hypothetical protein K2I89_08655 [Muribaculaceae bacterium]|nr:hypothetical protein [Muribaculaceae bacterium]MDE5595625.1 hypothetical protein [Muribaculaceae bacterium]
MDKNIALETLVEITNQNLGYVPTTPTEFLDLTVEIERKTGYSISLSSIKRIWGYVRYEGFPSVTTLNNLAQYNGFRNWEAFLSSKTFNRLSEDSGFFEESIVNPIDLNPGDRLMLSWGKDKSCEIECILPMRFRVIRAENIKLEAGDIFTLHTLCLGHPIYISDIVRGEVRLPAYIGAKKGGLTSITRRPN